MRIRSLSCHAVCCAVFCLSATLCACTIYTLPVFDNPHDPQGTNYKPDESLPEATDVACVRIVLTAPSLVTPTIYGTAESQLPANRFNLGSVWDRDSGPPSPWVALTALDPGYNYYCFKWYWTDAPFSSNSYVFEVDSVKIGTQYTKLVGGGHINNGGSSETQPASDVSIGSEDDGIVYTHTVTANVSDGKLAIFLVFGF